ncbi:MAG TPA: NUDIX domain-containing protein [Dermatophilaceae bacterium]|nr:NUDIX domain-containing protein [Dermatophilaceae bacterium]
MTDAAVTARALTLRCREALDHWQAPSHDQERLRLEYLALLRSASNGWSRACLGSHLTASSLICAPSERVVLLTLHGRIGRWLQTGGHIEPDDLSMESAALREAEEESGLNGVLDSNPLWLSRHAVPCGPVRPTYHLDVQYLVVVPVPGPPIISAESADLRWFGVDALPEVDDSVRALVRAAGERLGW